PLPRLGLTDVRSASTARACPCANSSGSGARGDLRGVGLLAGGRVSMQRPAAGGSIDRPHEHAVLVRDELGIPARDCGLETLRQRLDRRPVAKILHSLPLLDPDALLLLLDVRHSRKTPAGSRARRW